MTVNIIEILRRADQGVTRPYICRCDDDQIYFVKGEDAGRESQVREWIAGCLANKLGLPIAQFSLVYAAPEIATELGFCEIGAGYSFGSKLVQSTELRYTDVAKVPDETKQAVLAFDWWIKNNDRYLTEKGGNPNLFWAPIERSLVVIDHNQGFDESFSKNHFVNYHVFKENIHSVFYDMIVRQRFSESFMEALSDWEEICRAIPDSWMYIDSEETTPSNVNLRQMKDILELVQLDEFWELNIEQSNE